MVREGVTVISVHLPASVNFCNKERKISTDYRTGR